MSKKEQRKAPVLRFKGFTDDWEQRKLGTAIKIIKDKNKNQHSYRAFSISNIKGFIAQDEQFGKDNTYSKTDKSTNYIVKPGMFAYNPARINVGSIAYQNQTEPVLVSSLYEIFQTNSKIDDSFLMNWFKTSLFNRQIKRLEEGGVRQYFFIDKMKETEIKLPSSSEQNQISKLLQLVNKNLDLQQRKLDQLKQLKKAYLSDLFSIKNKPQIRFKGFKGKWKKSKLLDNVSNIIDFRGKTPKKLGMDWSDQGILALSALNVKDGFIDKSIHAHYGDIKLYNKWMAGNKLHKGQVLFTTEAPMGNVAQVPDNDKYILSQRTIAFNVNKDKISDFFLAMLLQTTTVHNQLLSLSSGGTAKGVSQKSLSGLSVAIPLSLEEQRKMEMAFKYINHLIHFQQDKIRYLEENKQFLLQNMFI